MADRQNKVAIGGMLHDIGKVLYRAADGRNHSRSGYEFLKDEVGITDEEILEQVLYHHKSLLKASSVSKDSPAYITYIADNIAAAADRRTKDTEDSGFDRNAALESVFNILNGNRGNMHYRQATLEDDGTIRIPTAENVQYDEHFYDGIRQHLKEVLSALTDENNIQESYLNSLLAAMEADLSFIPSSTDKGQLGDVSLYDHVKITAALAGCIYAWLEEKGITEYKEILFDREKEFYSKDVFLLYSMDMSGIQDFIYHLYGTDDVLKNLRARSFYLEILLENLIDELLDSLRLSRANLIYSGGGHAWLMLPNTERAAEKIRAFEGKANAWLLNTFGTELYMASGGAPCSAEVLENKPEGSYKELFRSVSRKVSYNKLHRYTAEQIAALNGIGNSGERGQDIVKIQSKGHEGTRECRICHRSDHLKEDNLCTICDGLSKLSKAVLTSEFYAVSSEARDGRLPVFEGQYLVPVGKDALRKMIAEDKYYIRSYSKNKMYTGQSYATKLWVADYSSAQTLGELVDESSGIRRLGVIRADVDNLGTAFVSGFPEEYQTLSRSASFSRLLSLFFKKNVNDILKNPKYYLDENGEKRNCTVIYAGGDDLFIIGAWRDIIEFSVDLQENLAAFSENTLKISAGIGVYDEKYPISYIAAKSGELESQSKHLDGKNAVTLFTTDDKDEDHTYKWQEFVNDALPYIGDRYYIPKPLAEIVTEKEGDSSVKKALKKLTFLPSDALELYVHGSLDIEQEATLLQHDLGEEYLIEKAAVETGKETMPYAVALYRYKEGSGLYICLGYETEEDYYQFCDILELVSYSGIGGKISSGYGKFTIVPVNPSRDYVKRLQAKGSGQYMSLSVCLPSPEEMELVTGHSNFRLVKRSGWISAGAAPDTIRKRRDLYMFASGSVFEDRFHGCMCDLSDGGTHPVLRYGYPMLMGVN